MKMSSEAPRMLEQLLNEPNKELLFSEVPSDIDEIIVEFVDYKKIPGYAKISSDAKYQSVVSANYGVYAKSSDINDDIPILTVAVKL